MSKIIIKMKSTQVAVRIPAHMHQSLTDLQLRLPKTADGQHQSIAAICRMLLKEALTRRAEDQDAEPPMPGLLED